jgi:hypothetical protein
MKTSSLTYSPLFTTILIKEIFSQMVPEREVAKITF